MEIDHCPFCGEKVEIPISPMMHENDDSEMVAPVEKIKDVFAKMGIGRREE